MIDQAILKRFSPLAFQWAKAQEDLILTHGVPLAARQIADAERVGVADPARVRVLVVDRIPMPDDPELAEAASRSQIITDKSRAVAVGHGIIIRADSWQDRELLLHQLVHVAQCERTGGLEAFVGIYLCDRTHTEFSVGSLEEQARRIAREICAADAAITA